MEEYRAYRAKLARGTTDQDRRKRSWKEFSNLDAGANAEQYESILKKIFLKNKILNFI